MKLLANYTAAMLGFKFIR